MVSPRPRPYELPTGAVHECSAALAYKQRCCRGGQHLGDLGGSRWARGFTSGTLERDI